MPVTRGFFRKRPESPAGRLPPGQYDTGGSWPVLTAEATPRSTSTRGPSRWTGWSTDPRRGPGRRSNGCRARRTPATSTV